MTAKNKDDFLFNLHNELHRIGIDDSEDIFADFEEHFRASAEQGFSEEETCAKLGDVKEIARSYIDIDSSKINSIVANAIEDSRPHVSLKKPGRSVPVSAPLPAENSAPQEEAAPETVIITEQPQAIREITPEHIAAEQPAPQAPAAVPFIPFPQPTAAQGETAEQNISAREVTPQHIAEEQPASASMPTPTDTAKENTGSIPQPSEPQKSPEQPETKDDHKAEIPYVENSDGKGGFRWSDIKGREPNVNIGKLIGQLCIDLFVLSWALPALAWLIWHFLTIIVLGICRFGISQLGGGAPFHFLSRIFLCGGLLSLACVLGLLWIKMVKGFYRIIRAAVIGHVKAIYNL